jgi:hypothetical protein
VAGAVGPKRHAVAFDMSTPSNLAQFEPAAEHALGDLTAHVAVRRVDVADDAHD